MLCENAHFLKWKGPGSPGKYFGKGRFTSSGSVLSAHRFCPRSSFLHVVQCPGGSAVLESGGQDGSRALGLGESVLIQREVKLDGTG